MRVLMRRWTARDSWTNRRLAEVARKQVRSGRKRWRSRIVSRQRHALRRRWLRWRLNRDNLERDRDNLTHLDEGQKIYRAISDCAPASAWSVPDRYGTFANMTDPSKLGPYMRSRCWRPSGARRSPACSPPIADKLHLKLVDEEINRTLIIDGVLMVRDAKSPTLVRGCCSPTCREASPQRG
jgi:hypothetical protein